jgi:hypothetical protein
MVDGRFVAVLFVEFNSYCRLWRREKSMVQMVPMVEGARYPMLRNEGWILMIKCLTVHQN